MTQIILSCSRKFLFKTKTFLNQGAKLLRTQMCSFIQGSVILSKMVTLLSLIQPLYLSQSIIDGDALPIEAHESFKMVYFNKNVLIFRNNTQILLAVQKIHTKETFLSLQSTRLAFYLHQHQWHRCHCQNINFY